MAITKVSRGLLNTGISDSSDATAITIDGSEQVGIGTTSPHTTMVVNGGTQTQISLQSSNSGTGANQGSLLSIDTSNNLYLWNYENLPTLFGTNNTEKMRILAEGGITFNGDTAAANALDDYEEGTWTPTIIGSSGTSGQSYSVQNGNYTRIGRFVHMTFDVRMSAKGTISGYVLLGGHGFTFLGNNTGGSLFTTFVSAVNNQDHYPVVGYIHQALIYLMNPPKDYLGAGDINDNTILIGSIVGQIA